MALPYLPGIVADGPGNVPDSLGKVSNGHGKVSDGLESRAPADREVSIKDLGLTRPGLGGTVLCLYTAT